MASSGEFVGDGERQRTVLVEEPVELAASGIEVSLLIFPAVMEEGSAVLDHLAKNQLHGLLSQRRIAVEIVDELSAQCPHVIDMFLDRLVGGKRSISGKPWCWSPGCRIPSGNGTCST